MSDLISRSALLEEIKRELERGRANDPFFDGTLFHYTGIKAIIENQPTAYDVEKVVPLSEIFRVIAGHSDYHGDNILSALTCIAEGKEVKPIKPIGE